MRTTRTAIAATAAVTMAVLTGCVSTAPTPASTMPEPTVEPAPAAPTLRAPETATGSSATLEVSAGASSDATEGTIYRYDATDWDASTIDCTAEPAETREVTLPAGGAWQSVSIPVVPGVISWVLVTGGQATPCGPDAAITRVLVETDLGIYIEDEVVPAVGQEVPIVVFGTTVAPSVPTPVEVAVFGPWSDRPAAEAAGCGEGAEIPVADIELTAGIGGSAPVTSGFVPDEPGVYLLVATASETEQSAAFSTCADTIDTDDLFAVAAS